MDELILRKDGSLNNNFPKRVGWFGYWFLVYSSKAHCVFSCRLSIYCGSVKPEASAKTQLYSVTLGTTNDVVWVARSILLQARNTVFRSITINLPQPTHLDLLMYASCYKILKCIRNTKHS